MSKFNTVRTGLLGSAAALALLGTATTAQAVEAQFGDVQITFDTTMSMGASMLTQGRQTQFLPETNGGPIDPRGSGILVGPTKVTPVGFGGAPCAISNAINFGVGSCGGNNVYTNNGYNFDGSINGDDGRLNFDRGDLIGANVKASHDLQISWQNYKIFARAVGFYDVIMNDEDAGSRSKLTDGALGDVGRNYDLLDLFISADYTVAEMPVNIRVGKQVINWGESTFIQGGLNAFNPIDVAAIRRPGSELKEALVPVNAVFTSISLPFDVSVAGYYALDWEPFEIDPSGTAFSGADVIALGTGLGGNTNLVSFVTSGPTGGMRRNCVAANGSGTNTVQTNGLLNDPNALGSALGNNLLECSDSPFVSNTNPFPVGQHELIRLGQMNGSGGQINLSGDMYNDGNVGILHRGKDTFARDANQYGIKATWFAESLNGTEFGFYYQNYHSRLPFVSVRGDATDTAADLGFFINSFNTEVLTGITSRQLPNLGCGLTNPALIGQIAGAAGLTMAGTIAGGISASAQAQMSGTPVADPGNILPTAAASLAVLSGGTFTLNPTNGFKNQLAVAQLNCALTYYQSGFVVPGGAVAPTVQAFDGAEFVLANMEGEVYVTYPEDIEVFGFSFNTTVGTWGLQGEGSYRPSAPFQVDTDSLTIASLVEGCTFQQLYGAAGSVVDGLANPTGTGIKPGCGGVLVSNQSGVIRNEMFTAQVGTTATFTASEWFIDAIGADLGILVSEVGVVVTPSVEDTWIDGLAPAQKANVVQYANTGCQGTDLPGGGILGLDAKRSQQCRPTDVSAGMVMLFSLQYNNFMDTGFVLSPTLVYSFDFEGTTAAPYGNYMEDRQALSLGMTGSLNNNFRMGVNYNSFFGGHVNNKSKDRDFASFTASYTF